MAKFYGKIGFAHSVESRPGVVTEEIVEYPYFGDLLRNSRKLQESEYLNDDLTVGNSISIVANAYANEHFHAIRYAELAPGSRWKVTEVTVEPPRLILRLGGVYHGRSPSAPITP